MTIKTVIQDAAREVGLPVPATIIDNDDENVAQMLRLATMEGRELVSQFDWSFLVNEKTFTAVAQKIQTSAVPTDFKRFINGTFFNRSRKRDVVGPLTPEEWQQQVSLTSTNVVDAFRYVGGNIWMVPDPTAGDTMVFEYISKNWIDTDADSAADAESFDADTNTMLFDEELITLGVVWRYLQAKGLDYGEPFRSYQYRLARLKGDDGGRRTMDFGRQAVRYRLSPRLPEGSWDMS